MYIEYHELLKKCKEAEKDFYNALDKRQNLLYLVSPHGVQPREIVSYLSNPTGDAKFLQYASEIEEMELLVNVTRNTRDRLEYDLEVLKLKLKESSNPCDRIYYYCWINGKKPSQVYRLIPCSRSSAYNYKDEVKGKLQELKEKMKKN